MPSSGLVHLGCPILREQLKRVSPSYHVFGHVHASSGEYEEGGIQFVNAAVVGGANFEVRNAARQLRI